MAPRPDPKQYDLSLLAKADARQAMLERMRGKLAAPSQATLARADKSRRASRMNAFGWGWRIGLTVLFLAANALVLTHKEEIRTVVRARTAPALPGPAAKLGLDDQALYYAYALYDFDRLRKSYGAPANAVIDAADARRRLAELMPKVSERTRFTIRRYLPAQGGRA